MRVIVVGGGAAGFFAAISAKQHHPSADVLLLEKSNKLLAKVRVSGGGRCNVTHDQPNIRKLSAHYPRGERFLRKVYEYFSVKDTIAWFAQRGVQLKTEADGRMFPISDDSGTIIRCLMDEAEEQGVRIALQSGVGAIDNATNGFTVHGKRRRIASGSCHCYHWRPPQSGRLRMAEAARPHHRSAGAVALHLQHAGRGDPLPDGRGG